MRSESPPDRAAVDAPSSEHGERGDSAARRARFLTDAGVVCQTHTGGAVLVPAQHTQALAAALRELIVDESLRRRPGAAAAETAREYRLEVIGPRWEALVTRLGVRPGEGDRTIGRRRTVTSSDSSDSR